MRSAINKFIIVSGVILALLMGVFDVAETYGEDNITMKKLLGIWWTTDSWDIPWAIQFKKDGTFCTAHTYLRLDTLPKDEGRFQFEGTSLILISKDDCESSCKGLKGEYKVEFTKRGKLQLKEQKDQCLERKEIFIYPWARVVE